MTARKPKHCGSSRSTGPVAGSSQSGWDRMREIEARIVPPTFPDRDFDVTPFGAVGDGSIDCRPAINSAIRKCSGAGGGRVVVPAGTYYVQGPILLDNNVNLHLQENAHIKFSRSWEDYLPLVPTVWEGVGRDNLTPFIHASHKQNIAITGKGIIDGQARTYSYDYWYPDRPVNTVQSRTGPYKRTALVEFWHCSNILVSGVSLTESPWRGLHPVYCENVTVRDVTIRALGQSYNTDGCNPDSSKYVLITGCSIFTGDDSIAIKSGRNEFGRKAGIPSECIIIRDCDLARICLGSEMSGGISDVYIEDCRIGAREGTEYYQRDALNTRSNDKRGGYIRRVFIRNITLIERICTAINFDGSYYRNPEGEYPTDIDTIHVENVSGRLNNHHDYYAISISGSAGAPFKNVVLKDIRLSNAANMLRVSNAPGIQMSNVKINGQEMAPS